ncbi:uncharacterized protein BDZ99DRAFT_459802 [Mytilinidion resinicola]|uniref:Uncharacterized protein n=1 Tax=Mytilinidion resinicola TaxID=574789 RepID=A0A6A6YZ91_9PEZI|nr:uncharacterized protein BDZ99DRAFT_459802 [Mytilinidion resinicola]KAF2814070.1 hypothetical protein BDZ99DRAFT_459802 [Mytilinidion resinicola]
MDLQLHLWDAEGTFDRYWGMQHHCRLSDFEGAYDVLSNLSLQSFHQLKGLKSLQISLAFDDKRTPNLARWCLGNGPAPMRMRSFVRDLVATIPENVELWWGMTEVEATKAVQETKFRGAREGSWWGFVAGEVLRKLADEFVCVRGIDAAYANEHNARA